MEFVTLKFRNLQSLLVCPRFLWKSALTRVEWISGWRSWLASRIQSCVWCLTFTRYMRWCVFRYVRNPRIESSWLRRWRGLRWNLQKLFPIYHAYFKYLTACCCGSAFPTGRLRIPPGSRKGGSNAGCVRRLFSVKEPNSSFAEVRMRLLIEATHMEAEDEEQENEKEDERDSGEYRIEGRRVSDQTHK